MAWLIAGIVAAVLLLALVAAYAGVVTGSVNIDVGLGRRLRPLGPLTAEIAAPRELVFDVIAAPYLQRQPRTVAEKLHVLERADTMVLAAHRTPIRPKLLTATTVETVRFTRPERVDFRLVRGPVPHVVEQFALTGYDGGTRLVYTGELGTDFGPIGAWWGTIVGRTWERTVSAALESVKTEAERRARVS